jgi:hypothetical protein
MIPPLTRMRNTGWGAVAGPRDAAVSHPEGAAVPRAAQAVVVVVAVRQRSGQVAAPVGEHVDALAVADHDDGHVAEHPLDRPSAVHLVERHEVMPAGLDEVRHRFGLVPPGHAVASRSAR